MERKDSFFEIRQPDDLASRSLHTEMRGSEPRPVLGNFHNSTPEVPEILPEPYVNHVKSDNYQRRDRPSNVPWNEFCSDCWITKFNSHPSYQRATSHYLEISRVEVPHRCGGCDNRVAHVYPARACKYCRIAHKNLLEHLGKTKNTVHELVRNVVRIESGEEAHHATPKRD